MAACLQSALQLVAEHLLGLFGARPVATANVVAVQPDFADLPIGYFHLVLRVDDNAPLAAGDPTARNLRDGVRSVARDSDRVPRAQLLSVQVDSGRPGGELDGGAEKGRLGHPE